MMLMALFENASIVCLQDKQQNIAALRNSNYFELIVVYHLKYVRVQIPSL